MKKIISLTCLITLSITFSLAQNNLSISGQVFSAISEMPVHRTYIRVRVDSFMEKMVFLNEKGEFKIMGLQKGKHKLFLEELNEAGDFYYSRFDTLIVLNKSMSNVNLLLPKCSYCNCVGIDRKSAKSDIEQGNFRLFVTPVGISGLMEPQVNDDEFQKKYAIRYAAFGCVFPEFECIEGYNTVMFDYLDKKFGTKWRKEARTDVIYLDKD